MTSVYVAAEKNIKTAVCNKFIKMDSKIVRQFGRQELGVLRLDIQAALDNIKEKYSLSELTLEGVYFTSTSFNAKISGKTQTFEADLYEKSEALFFALRHGLPENLLESKFTLDGQSFEVSCLEVRNTKYPIIALCKDTGKTFKFSVSQIKKLLMEKNSG